MITVDKDQLMIRCKFVYMDTQYSSRASHYTRFPDIDRLIFKLTECLASGRTPGPIVFPRKRSPVRSCNDERGHTDVCCYRRARSLASRCQQTAVSTENKISARASPRYF